VDLPEGARLLAKPHADADEVDADADVTAEEVWLELPAEGRLVDGKLVPQVSHWLVSPAGHAGVDLTGAKVGS